MGLTLHLPPLQAFIYVRAEWQTPTHAVNEAVLWSDIAEQAEAAVISLPHLHVAYPYTLTDRGALSYSASQALLVHGLQGMASS